MKGLTSIPGYLSVDNFPEGPKTTLKFSENFETESKLSLTITAYFFYTLIQFDIKF